MTQIVAIEREAAPVDDEADPVWQPLATMRAAVKPVRASESEREGALREVQVYLFTVHTSELRAVPVTASDRIVWNGRAYNIREVRTPEPRIRTTEIVAESGVTL